MTTVKDKKPNYYDHNKDESMINDLKEVK